MAARYATVSFWFHNTTSGHDEYCHLGSLRDSTTAVVTQYPAMFGTSPLVVTQLGGCDPKLGEYLKVHAGGPGELCPVCMAAGPSASRMSSQGIARCSAMTS